MAVLGQDPILGPYAENRTVDTWTWSLQLTQPLWTLPPFFAYGAAQAAVKAANWRVDEAKAQYAPSLALIASYGANASSGSLATPDNYALQSHAWAAGAQIGYRLGTRTDLDVLTALRTLYRAKRRYAQARYRMVLAGLALKAAVGALTEADVRGINALLKGAAAR